jgi:hypothetical protein
MTAQHATKLKEVFWFPPGGRRLFSKKNTFFLAFLSGCQPTPKTPQQFCAQVANHDPVVKDLIMKAAGSDILQSRSQGDIAAARRRAELDCLRRQGIGPTGGGVQAPARSTDTLYQR